MGFKIKSIHAREIFGRQNFPAIEVTVVTDDGISGTAVVASGASVGKHEASFVLDTERYNGRGVLRAVNNVSEFIAPALKGMDVTKQREIDDKMIELDGTPNKSRLGANVMVSTSAAVLKAGAKSLKLPLYQHIGGLNACIMPVPCAKAVGDQGTRYGKPQEVIHGKPSYSFICYGFKSFSEAAYAGWRVQQVFLEILKEKGFNLIYSYGLFIPVLFEKLNSDRELWEIFANAIERAGYNGKVGIQVDVAAGTYYEREKDKYVGLFSRKDKTREDLIELYKDMVATYPFMIFEDPLNDDDFDGHAILTKELGVEIVGDDLTVTNPTRVREAIDSGAVNTMLLKVNQVGTISEAFEAVQMAYQNGLGVMPCSSRGEGEAIADYTVGLLAKHMRGGSTSNRLLKIEAELGKRARFLGKASLKVK
ncbi:MAG: phosphopyruvate hydratase [Candidatus Bathyarchaeota archaeon]|jgi:enolase|nr:phosphopyruvate hydratase [Candidatus Bathyarchaeota archaeon]